MSPKNLIVGGLAAALLSLAPVPWASAAPRGVHESGAHAVVHGRVRHGSRHEAIAAFRRRHSDRHAMRRPHRSMHGARASRALGPYRGFHPRAVHGAAGTARPAAQRGRRFAHRSYAYGGVYGGSYPQPPYDHARYGWTYGAYAPRVYGGTIAGPSPSLPLYNRPSCGCD